MEITWLGRNCFRLKGREGTVITDPCPPDSGYSLGKLQADLVTLSMRDDPAYSYTKAITGSPVILDAPGEYEVKGILATGIPMKRADGTRNMVFAVVIDGIRVVHLGLPDGAPDAKILEALDDVDVLLMPVGGGNSLTADAASNVMEMLDPHIAIPMNYKTDIETADLVPIDHFLRETGTKTEPLARLQVTTGSIPSELSVQVLQPKT